MVDVEGEDRGGGEDIALVHADVERTGAGWSPFFKSLRFRLSGRPSCVNERCKHNETWLFLLLCKQAFGVSKDLIDLRTRGPGPFLLWWRTLGTRAMVKAGGGLLETWVRMGVSWSVQASGRRVRGHLLLEPSWALCIRFWVKTLNFKAIVAVIFALEHQKTE